MQSPRAGGGDLQSSKAEQQEVTEEPIFANSQPGQRTLREERLPQVNLQAARKAA